MNARDLPFQIGLQPFMYTASIQAWHIRSGLRRVRYIDIL